MIILLLLWNLFSLEDISIYQNMRYQKDRYLETMQFHLWDGLLMIIGGIVIFLFDAFNQKVLLTLMILVLLPSLIRKGKNSFKSLKVTKRIIRLLGVMGVTTFLILFFLLNMNFVIQCIVALALCVFHHTVFYFYLVACEPLEMKIRQNYVLLAKRKLEEFKGIRIGITGSYGKTSIKNLVYDVLSMKYVCLKTRASFNNEMGITKTILEEMDHQEVFICEMGADHLHEIEDLCQFVQPTIGIVAAVGPQHLSTFKTMENILHEKMQLLESLPAFGKGYYNFDNFYLFHYPMELRAFVVRVGLHSEADIKAVNVQCDHLGSQFDVEIQGELVHFTTKLLGEHNILNCLFAIALGIDLGVSLELIRIAIQCSSPVEHRMELKPFGKGMVIDNAYNSNPQSAQASLAVLKMMPGKQIIITPGFLDLGELKGYYSEEFGKQMSFCDKVILVGECEAIERGLTKSNYDKEKIYQTDSMKKALMLALSMMDEGDTLLIENDIPKILMNTPK